jgi:hypothetical protein
MTVVTHDTRQASSSVSAIAGARLDAVELGSSPYPSTPKIHLACTWHREADGRLFCRWRQVSADELGALSVEPRCSSTEDRSPLRQELGAQAIVRRFAIATLLASAVLSLIVCFLGG